MKVSLVIPVYNEANWLDSCLRAVARQSVIPYEVIVVDNNSTDGSAKLALKYKFVKVVEEVNQGVSYANRRGFNEARGSIIARIDADTILPVDWIDRVGKYFIESKGFAGVSGRAYFYDLYFGKLGGYIQAAIYQKFQHLILGNYVLWGSTMALKKSDWKKVNQSLLMGSKIHDDLDLSLALSNQHLNVDYLPDLVVGVSFQRQKFSPLSLAKFLYAWPKNYVKRKRYLASITISVLSILIWLGSFLLYPFKRKVN